LKGIEVKISNTQKSLPIDSQQLRRTVEHVLERLSCSLAAVSLAVVDNHAISQLQARYFGTPEATDVLSFDLRDRSGDVEADSALDCEVVVNAEKALEVAQAHNADPLAELNLYVVHGLLHQLGFDDRSAEQARIMHQKEDQLLQELGFGNVYNNGDKMR